jgi:Ca2+-transporting ATPase
MTIYPKWLMLIAMGRKIFNQFIKQYEMSQWKKNTMTQKPRPLQTLFLVGRNCQREYNSGFGNNIRSTLSVYQFTVYQGFNEHVTRTMVFLVLVTSNVFLTLTGRFIIPFYFEI